jgi:hypothetical protein
MKNEISSDALMAVALQGLKLEYTHVHAESGENLWHVNVGGPNNSTVLTLFVGPFTAGVTCVVGEVLSGPAQRCLDLLRLNANLTLAKVALRDEHVFVQAEIPSDQINDKSLRLAITSVLDAVGRVKAVAPMAVVYGSIA